MLGIHQGRRTPLCSGAERNLSGMLSGSTRQCIDSDTKQVLRVPQVVLVWHALHLVLALRTSMGDISELFGGGGLSDASFFGSAAQGAPPLPPLPPSAACPVLLTLSRSFPSHREQEAASPSQPHRPRARLVARRRPRATSSVTAPVPTLFPSHVHHPLLLPRRHTELPARLL